MNNKELLYKKLNALRLEVDSSIVDDIVSTVDDLFSQQNGAKPNVSGALPPSDEEITKALNTALKLKNADIDDSIKSVWIEGAQWMRDLMFGGNDR